MKNSTKGKLLKGAALGIDVIVPFMVTLSQFPVWVERSSDATMSGTFLLLAFFSVIPFIKQLQEYFKSPAIPVVWIVVFVFLICLRNIIDEMIVVCFAGTASNLIGAGIYKIGAVIEGKEDK
jgi:uncharacterized membrane protein YhaH (DUF805 family)